MKRGKGLSIRTSAALYRGRNSYKEESGEGDKLNFS